MKYILTEQYQPLVEKEGAIENRSSFHTINLASATTTPDGNTPFVKINKDDIQNFKALEGETMYAKIVENDHYPTLEVSVVTFIPEQIQNLSKGLPEGTILAVDYRKGVTAQDYEGNLIEPNGIETTIGHDTGVFYNADGSFQGQRDRTKGLWAGRETVNLTNFVGLQESCTATVVGDILTIEVISGEGRPLMFFADDLYESDTEYTVSWEVLEDTNNNYSFVYFHAQAFGSLFADVHKEGSKTLTSVSVPGKLGIGVYLGGGAPIGTKIKIKINVEKSPIATPSCEKNRGDYRMSYPCVLDLRTDIGYLIKRFDGKVNSSSYTLLSLGLAHSLYANQNIIDNLNHILKNEDNCLIINFNNSEVSTYVNGVNTTSFIKSDANPPTGNIFLDKDYVTSSVYSPNNYSKKVIIGKGRNLTAEEIELYTNSDIEIPDIGEYYPVAYAKKRTDQYGTYKRGWKVISTDEDIFEIKDRRYKITDKLGVETIVFIDENGVKTGNSLDQVNGYLRVNSSVVLPCNVEVL